MRVEVRIEFATGLMAETGRDEIAGHAFAILAGLSHPGFREFFQLQHRVPNRFVVQRQNTIILIQGTTETDFGGAIVKS